MSLPAWIPIFGPISDRRRAWRELPELGARLGLRFTESNHRYQLGTFDGTVQGHSVRISPDVPSVAVRFTSELEELTITMLDIGNKRRGQVLGHPRFERKFPTIVLGPRQAEALRGHPEALDRVLALLRHRVCGISLSQVGLSCAMYNPYRFFSKNIHYITAADLERLLPEMIETVRLLESVLHK